MGGSFHSVKVPCRNFGFQVLFCSVYTGCRKGYFHHQFLSRLHIKSGNDTFAFFCFAHRKIKRIYNRAVELHHKEIVLIYPHSVIDVSGQCLCVFPVYFTTVHLGMVLFFSPCRPMLQVDQDRSRIGFKISVTMQSRVDRSSQFRFHLRIGKFNRIITRSGSFLIFGEMATISIPCTGTCTSGGHYQNISQIHASRSVQMGLGESPNQRILINIFGTVSPTDRTCHRTGLHHSERITSTGKRMTIISGTNKGINVLSIILRFRFFCRGAGRIKE